jgi:phosphate/phosphite/phosphonate ABC transporter binding protein
MTRLLLGVLLLGGCDEQPEAARGRIFQTPASAMYEQTRTTLNDAGIDHLVWGLTPFVSPTGVDDQYRPTIGLISERLRVPIHVRAGRNYEHVEEMLLSGEVDIALMSPYAYVRAKARAPNIRVFATHIAKGTESYGAYILTQEDSPIRTMNDLRGEVFGFVDQRSSSGWLFPISRMLDDGINPLQEITGHFYGSHERVIEAIVNGEVSAGATYDGALAEGRGRIPGANNLRVLARTQRIPYDAYVLREGFPEMAILGLQKALSSVSTRDARGRDALSALVDINGFIQADDAHYRGVRIIEEKVQRLLDLPGGTLPSIVPTPPTEDPGTHHDDSAPIQTQ